MTSPYQIPFNKPSFAGKENEYIAEAIRLGQVSGDGPFSHKCHKLLENLLQVKKVLLTTSCTHALEMAAILLNLEEGDEVILPSFTFVSTANAFVLRGARPVFADICPDTLNIDPKSVKSLISKKTKAIAPVHYAGVGCKMNEIAKLAKDNNLSIVEDNAHGLFGKYENQMLGTFGALATQSFHETKNFHCGEGGALLINDETMIERAEIIREKGTNRSRFFRGQVDKYTWVDVGSSYLPSDILAAFLLAQLEEREQIQNKRREVWQKYSADLAAWAENNGVRLPHIPDNCQQTYHMFYLLMPDLETRQAFISHMKSNQILSVYHYLPLHLSPMGLSYGGQAGDCPITESVSDRLVRLPFYNTLKTEEQERVINAVTAFSPKLALHR